MNSLKMNEVAMSNRRYESPLGELTLLAQQGALVAVLWQNDRRWPLDFPESDSVDESVPDGHRGDSDVLDTAARQLGEYFQGIRREFDVPLARRGTAFQRQVWASLKMIPYGQTWSYGYQAASIDRPSAVRAVAAANGRNPLSIVLPCHRVVAADGSLAGFAGGLEAKAWLLSHEAENLPALPARPARG